MQGTLGRSISGVDVMAEPRRFYSDFNTVFVPLLLLAAGVGLPAACFLMSKMFCLLKYNQSRIAQARDKHVEENQDERRKGCSVNSER